MCTKLTCSGIVSGNALALCGSEKQMALLTRGHIGGSEKYYWLKLCECLVVTERAQANHISQPVPNMCAYEYETQKALCKMKTREDS